MLYNKNYPVYKNLTKMEQEVEEVRIIKENLKKWYKLLNAIKIIYDLIFISKTKTAKR